MSTAGSSNSTKGCPMKTFDLHDGSDELDVFEATRYYSGDVEDVVPDVHPVAFGDVGAVSPVREASEKKHTDAKTEPSSDQVFDVKSKKKNCRRQRSPISSGSRRLTCLLNSFLQQAAASNIKLIKCFQPIPVTNNEILSSEEEEEQERGRRQMIRSSTHETVGRASADQMSGSGNSSSNTCSYYFDKPDPLYDQMSGSGNSSSANRRSSLGRSVTLSSQREIAAPKADHSMVIRDVYCVGNRWVLLTRPVCHGLLKDVWPSAGDNRHSEDVEEGDVAEMSDSSSDLFELDSYDQ